MNTVCSIFTVTCVLTLAIFSLAVLANPFEKVISEMVNGMEKRDSFPQMPQMGQGNWNPDSIVSQINKYADEQQAKAKEAEAKAKEEQEKAKLEQEKAKLEQEKAKAEQEKAAQAQAAQAQTTALPLPAAAEPMPAPQVPQIPQAPMAAQPMADGVGAPQALPMPAPAPLPLS